jgi:hypothetical protein
MYNYLYDELNKLWDVAPMQQSELISQIERLRAYIQLHLSMVDAEINQASQEPSAKKRKRKTKKEMAVQQ